MDPFVSVTYISQVHQAVLADVGAGAALWRDDATADPLLVADDAQLRGAHPAGQVHVEHRAQLLEQLGESGEWVS